MTIIEQEIAAQATPRMDAEFLDSLDIYDNYAGLRSFAPRKIVKMAREHALLLAKVRAYLGAQDVRRAARGLVVVKAAKAQSAAESALRAVVDAMEGR